MMCNRVKHVIIDVDVGTDDYLALMMFLHAEKIGTVKIEGIVCTRGNTTVENVTRNVVRLLEIAGRTDILVYQGCSDPLILNHHEKVSEFCGKDGLGDLKYDKEPDLSVVEDIPAAIGIRDMIYKARDDVIVICLAPLTNVALALKLFQDLHAKIKQVWIMGGSYQGVGNVAPTAEFNFYVDPEAVRIVFDNVKCPISVLPWEPCIQTNLKREWLYNALGRSTDPAFQLLIRAEKGCHTGEIWKPSDAYLAAAFLYPCCIILQELHWATVELHGHCTRGQLVIDHCNKQKVPNVNIIKQVDVEYVQGKLLEMAGLK